MIPYLILPTIYLFIGNRLLHEKIESPPVPFSMNPKFDEMIRFGNLRISQLPLETRIGINLTVVGGKGRMMVIGCVQTNLFDKEGKIRQGRVELNVWPFY
jgi:phosphatidylinositol-4,5-bisphosphate 3-kinase catalytic subunit alpha/beta/delta